MLGISQSNNDILRRHRLGLKVYKRTTNELELKQSAFLLFKHEIVIYAI